MVFGGRKKGLVRRGAPLGEAAGFTLVELMLVMTLLAFLVPALRAARREPVEGFMQE